MPPVKTKKVDKKDGVAVKKTQGVKKAKAQPKPKNNALEKLKKKDDNKGIKTYISKLNKNLEYYLVILGLTCIWHLCKYCTVHSKRGEGGFE